MRNFSTTDIDRKSSREQAALYEEVFKALGHHRQQIKKEEANLQVIRRAQSRKIMRPNM
jgi:hypothetical protein